MHLLLFLSPEWLAYFLSHDYLSHVNSLGFLIYFLFLSDEGPTLETLDYTIPYRQYTNLFIFRFVSLLCLRSTLRL